MRTGPFFGPIRAFRGAGVIVEPETRDAHDWAREDRLQAAKDVARQVDRVNRGDIDLGPSAAFSVADSELDALWREGPRAIGRDPIASTRYAHRLDEAAA